MTCSVEIFIFDSSDERARGNFVYVCTCIAQMFRWKDNVYDSTQRWRCGKDAGQVQ